MARKRDFDPVVARNRKARFRFEIVETCECGIVLTGSEVKSLRDRQVSLDEAYARIYDEQVWLIGCHIAPYPHAGKHNHDPDRKRKLLLHKSEVRKIIPKLKLKGFTLVPLEIHFNARSIAKVTLGLAVGRATRDKRQTLQNREAKREIERALKRRRK